MAQIQNAGLGEFRLRDLNDEINKESFWTELDPTEGKVECLGMPLHDGHFVPILQGIAKRWRSSGRHTPLRWLRKLLKEVIATRRHMSLIAHFQFKTSTTSAIKRVIDIPSNFKIKCMCRHVATTSFDDFLSHLTIPLVLQTGRSTHLFRPGLQTDLPIDYSL